MSKRLAFDDALRACAFDDEAHAGLRVAMGDGMLAGLKHLDIELKGVCRRSFIRTAKPDHSPRNHLQADDFARLRYGILDVFPFPQARFVGWKPAGDEILPRLFPSSRPDFFV